MPIKGFKGLRKEIKEKLRFLLKNYGQLYSKNLGINVDSRKSEEIFKWFLASILYGKRISEKIATNTYREFEKEKLLTPDAILAAGWDKLVEVLDKGGYVRYDFSTATKLLEITKELKNRYGDLNKINEIALSPRDLEQKFQEFKGIGPVTTQIFLRELRGIWKNANPALSNFALIATKKLGIKNPEKFWDHHKIKGYDFRNFECALLRSGRIYKKEEKKKKR